MPRYSRNVRGTAALLTFAFLAVAGICYASCWVGYQICVIGHNVGLLLGRGISRGVKRLPSGQVVSRRLSHFSETIGLGLLAVLTHAGQVIQLADRQILKLTGDDIFMAWFCRSLVLLVMVAIGGTLVYGISHLLVSDA